MRIILILSALFFAFSASAQSGAIQGQIIGTDTGEGIPFANVALFKNDVLITGVSADYEGNYSIKPVDPGTYKLEFTAVGFNTKEITGVDVTFDAIRYVNAQLSTQVFEKPIVDVIVFRKPLFEKGKTVTETTLTQEEIESAPTRDIGDLVNYSAQASGEEGRGTNLKGGRADGALILVDGVKVRSAQVPNKAIEQMTVITGGIPAKYGDATGGVISITTRGPSRDFTGSLEVVSSQFLDPYNYNLIGGNLSGPILWKNKEKKQPLLGFSFSAEVLHEKDPYPSAIGAWQVKEDVLDSLQQYPLMLNEDESGLDRRAETITFDDLEHQKARPNVEQLTLNFNNNFDVALPGNKSLRLGGSLGYNDYHNAVFHYSLFNAVNNPRFKEDNWRAFARFTQNFPSQREEGEDAAAPLLENAYYAVQIDYSRFNQKYGDDSHDDEFFDYGYVGQFHKKQVPIFEPGFDSSVNGGISAIILQGYKDSITGFDPGNKNPFMTRYTEQFFDISPTAPTTLDDISGSGALINGQRSQLVHGIWYNTGREYNGYGIYNQDQYSLSLDGSVDVNMPGANNRRNKHAIEFGIEYEQRVEREYTIGPLGLWTLARQLTNKHLTELDTDNPQPDAGMDTIYYPREYDASEQSNFDRNLRAALGYDETSTKWINVDSISPDFLNINMFSPDELFQGGSSLYSAYGYDYTGKVLDEDVNFFDFWTDYEDINNNGVRDANDRFTRKMPAFRPIYMAGYIQDRFSYKDIDFNVGVRIDRYDANTKVLRDPHSLYPIRTADEVAELQGNSITHPENIAASPEDFKVYGNDIANPSTIVAYRRGDTWFDAQGEEVQDPKIFEQQVGGIMQPYLQDPTMDIKDPQFDPEAAFEDYDPQISVMPRIAFSFSISEQAQFFAHYDVLTQRPRTQRYFERGTFNNPAAATPFDYYFLQERQFAPNPALKPEKTIDYELGFKQRVSTTSAITISAFYREMRDMIQLVRYGFAHPIAYTSYGNMDFGTVKGLTFVYDLRRTGNVKLLTSYTLQFADGTGSSFDAQRRLIQSDQPNLRATFPLSYDRRHKLNINLSYVFGAGSDYNGPMVFGKRAFENSGASLFATITSGTPYTSISRAVPWLIDTRGASTEGSVNGARKPWQYRIDGRLYKNFTIERTASAEEGEEPKAKSPLGMEVYLLVKNILNTKNIVSVYQYTGDPMDDGYLTSAQGEEDLANQENPQSFEDLYRLGLRDPLNFGLPRRIRLGAVLTF